MSGIVVAMPKAEDARRIGDIIKRSGISNEVVICQRGAEILRLVRERDIGVVVCVKKYSDMAYGEISSYLPAYVCMVLLTVDPNLIITNGSIVKVTMPLKATELISTIQQVMPTGYVPRKKKKIRNPEEQLVIDQAKELLMEKQCMTEPEAFRYIQKNSMDTGRSMLESAQMILLLGGG